MESVDCIMHSKTPKKTFSGRDEMEGHKIAQEHFREALLILATGSFSTDEKIHKIELQCISKINTDHIPHLLKNDFERLKINLEKTHEEISKENLATISLITQDVIDMYTKITEWIAIENYIYNQNVVISSNFKKHWV